MKKNRKYKRLKSPKYVAGFIKVNKSLNDFNSIDEALTYIFKDKDNVKRIKEALNKNVTGKIESLRKDEAFKDYRTENTKLKAFVKGRIMAAREIAHSRHKYPSVGNLIANEFKTTSYVSQEERFASNISKMFNFRDKGDFEVEFKDKSGKTTMKHTKSKYRYTRERQFLVEHFGTTDLRSVKGLKVGWLKGLPDDMDLSYDSKDKGYETYDLNGNRVIFEIVKEKYGDTEYKINVVIRYEEDGVWKSIRPTI